MIDPFKLPVFPAADVFPMMADDELQELAADIAENGLREPLVLATIDRRTVLVDGRNRRAACKLAGVVPGTRFLNGEDPTSYVLSANIHRRHMTKSQRAYAIAKIYPEEMGRNAKGGNVARNLGVSGELVRQARFALRYAPDIGPNIRSGALALDKAYETARERKTASENQEARMLELRSDAPDLADLVTEERMKLAEAIAAWRERQRVTAQRVEAGQNAARTMLLSFASNVETIQQGLELGASIKFKPDHVALYKRAVSAAVPVGIAGAAGSVLDDKVRYFPTILEFEHSPGTVSAVTYKIRAGLSSANGSLLVNDASLYAAVSRATLVLEEINVP